MSQDVDSNCTVRRLVSVDVLVDCMLYGGEGRRNTN